MMIKLLATTLLLGLALPAAAQETQPPGPPPSEAPPALQAPPPAPPAGVAPAPVPGDSPSQGQWVYTGQYGWVWMPYGAAYSYAPAVGAPYAYVYGPVLGWRWVHAPWIYGWGPRPYWGTLGFGRFYWHAHPFYPVRRVYPYRYGLRAGRHWHR